MLFRSLLCLHLSEVLTLSKLTDFNDMAALFGLSSVRLAIDAAKPVDQLLDPIKRDAIRLPVSMRDKYPASVPASFATASSFNPNSLRTA